MNINVDKPVLTTTQFNCLSALQEELAQVEKETVSFFQCALFNNIPSNYKEIHEFYTGYMYKIISNKNRVSFSKFYLVFSYLAFRSQFSKFIQNDLKNVRSRWLLLYCDPSEIVNFDAKAQLHYFQSLETNKTLEYMKKFKPIDNWLKKEYKRVRLQLFFSILKTNSIIILFWLVVFIVFVFCLFLASKNSSITPIQQIKIWINFIFGKNML